MTDSGPGATVKGSVPPEQAATEALARLRELLLRAGAGDAEPTEVSAALAAYWRENGETLRAAARSVSEIVRLQLLDQLYKWRDELSRQLPSTGQRR